MKTKLEVPHPIPDVLAEMIARRFRVLGDANRLRLLDCLRDGPMTVGELTEATGLSQQNVSKHLGILHEASLLSREREGTQVRCSIADPAVFELCEHVCGGLRRQIDDLDSALSAGA